MLDLIAKKYRVLKDLGQGAMGDVYLVLPPRGEPVALKLLKSLDAQTNSEAIKQFENEFQTLKRLRHPNIGQIFDYGYDDVLQKVFFTLPWLKGKDIYEYSNGLGFEACENLFVQVLRALNYLHQKKVIHCDLKPANIFVEDGTALILDFGLAGYWGENVVGTPTYLAPELFRGEPHSVASDLYAVGVIFYNCLTRSQPFSGKTLQEIYDRHRTFTAPPISEINPLVPKYFSDIIATLLNKKADERYPSAANVIEEIDAYSKNNYSVETEATLLSYLPSDADMLGRRGSLEDALMALKDFRSDQVREPYHLILIHGPKNVGKGRLVSMIKNKLQLTKISVEVITPPLSPQDEDVVKTAKALILENVDLFFLSSSDVTHFQQAINIIEQKLLSPTLNRFVLIVSSSQEKDFGTVRRLFPLEDTRITTLELKPFTKQEIEEWLKKVIGQEEIPEKFRDQFYQNTEGLPETAFVLLQSMIENGLLFDKAGRWSEDLLANLDKTFDKLQISASLEQDFEKIYNALSAPEEDVVNWLSLCPHPLTREQLTKIAQQKQIQQTIQTLVQKNIARQDAEKITLQRTVFQNFIQNNLPDTEMARRHSALANPALNLEKKWSFFHLSRGQNTTLRLKASVKLAQLYEASGQRDEALQTYLLLLENFKNSPLEERISWILAALTLMIWLDRFEEAVHLASETENEIHYKKISLDAEKFLTLIEKKGLALLHQQNIEKARTYFENGLKLTRKFEHCKVHQIRFENNLAEMEFLLGHNTQAIQIFKETREAAKLLPQDQRAIITNNDLGHVFLTLKDAEEALVYLKEDMGVFEHLKNQEPLARALYSFTQVMELQQNFDKAIEGYEACIKICRAGHFYPLLLRAYNGLGNLYLSRQNNKEALINYQKAIDLAVRLKDSTSKAALLFNQAIIHREANNLALATRRYLTAKQVLENKETKLLAHEEALLASCYSDLAEIAHNEKNPMKALGFELEHLRLIEASSSLIAEKIKVKLSLATLYLENRLRDQFLREVKEIEPLVHNSENQKKLNDLKQQWQEVEKNKEQEDTGRITPTTP